MVEKKKICKKCGIKINESAKCCMCQECRAKQNAKWKSRFMLITKILAPIAAVAGLVYLLSRSSNDDADSTPTSDSGSEPEHASGEKYWNIKTQNWEKDGKPYTYRVTYKDVRDGEIYTQDYTDVDNGYEDYEYYRKQWYTSGAKWDHVPPEDD